MKNITFFINTLSAAGGTQRVLTSLVNGIEENYNITILVLDDEKSFFNIKSEVDIKRIVLNSKFMPLRILDFNKQIYKELKNSLCDYYISLDSNSVLMQSLFIPRRTKLILWEHFSISKNFNKVLFRLSRYYASLRAYKFILLSEQEVRDWSKIYNIPARKISLIYNPITIEEELNFIDAEDLYKNKKILAIGNNIHVKGFDYLIEAWSLLDKNDWILEIVGLSKNEQIKLTKIISEYDLKNEIIVHGRISDIKETYLQSSIYCLCSRMEATPLVLIESQYIGLPAIVFDNCEGPLELLKNSGLVVEFGDVKQYANAMTKLINSKSEYQELSRNARANSLRFNTKTFYEKWCHVLN